MLGRKKDIRYKMTPESVDELAALQRQILDTVHTYVKPNGVLTVSYTHLDVYKRQILLLSREK